AHARHVAGRAVANLGRAADDGRAHHQRRGRGHPARGPDLSDDARARGRPGAAHRSCAAKATAAPSHEPGPGVPEGAPGARRVPEELGCNEAASTARSVGGLSEERVAPSFVEIAQLGKTYETPAGPAVVVRDFTLEVGEGEFVCLVGHSGCGKSTV